MYKLEKINQKIGLSINILRINHNMSARQLGSIVGKSECTITAWERGERSPSLNSLLIVCNLFNCQLEDLFEPDLCKEIINLE